MRITSTVKNGLRFLVGRTSHAKAGAVTLPTFGGTGLRAGVDLEDRGALLDLLDRR